MARKISVSGTGCCLVDRLYNNISFRSESIAPYMSGERGDGGLVPGQLVFQEELESFSGLKLDQILTEISEGKPPDKINIGGPAIVALIHAAQINENPDCTFRFYGCYGNDEEGDFLVSSLDKTPVRHDQYILCGKNTPSTIVLSDPEYERGHGERMFINSIGGAWSYGPDNLDNDFFSSNVVVFGGTALVPQVHHQMTELLEKAKSNGCITVVNTVFDFRSEKTNPGKRWPLGESDRSYGFIDLLIMDKEEALSLSGEKALSPAMDFFRNSGTGAVAVTNGAENIHLYSSGRLFEAVDHKEMPVSNEVRKQIQQTNSGDTTGCGDNFAGGLISSIAEQLEKGKELLDLPEACIWGIISGGLSCFYLGGTFLEQSPGEKRRMIRPYYENYKKQIHG